jgi:3-hydroxyisobutyrate dehydrogenase-like beta-hydroxyacid dehydrogenase
VARRDRALTACKKEDAMSEPIGFIGLGLLGLPMATNLADAGHSLCVYNRTASKADPLVARGARRATRPVDAVTPGGIVVTALWDGAVLEAAVTSDGFLEQLGAGGLHISTSTVLPETSKRLAALHHQHGCEFVEAPIFGRPEAATAKQLWIPIAGPSSAKARARPVLEAMGAQGIFDFGETVGAALIVKLVGNFLISSAGRSMVEALAMADKAGVDPKAVVEMLTTTLFTAPIYKSYGKRIAETGALFSGSKIPEKDLGLFQETARSPTPIAALMLELSRT